VSVLTRGIYRKPSSNTASNTESSTPKGWEPHPPKGSLPLPRGGNHTPPRRGVLFHFQGVGTKHPHGESSTPRVGQPPQGESSTPKGWEPYPPKGILPLQRGGNHTTPRGVFHFAAPRAPIGLLDV
jgi:hypothetical protein